MRQALPALAACFSLALGAVSCGPDHAGVDGLASGVSVDEAEGQASTVQAFSATLCTGTNYTGTCKVLPLGAFNFAAMVAAGVANDSVKSIRLTPNTVVWAYLNANYAGTEWTVGNGGLSDLSSIGAAAAISSLVVGPDPNIAFNVTYPHGALCLDSSGTQPTDGVTLQVANCTSQTSQAFRFAQVSPGVFNIVTQAGQKCVDVYKDSSADGASVALWDCTTSDKAEQFAFLNASTTGSFNLAVPSHSKCLDVYAAGTVSGSRVDQYTCNTSAAQVWGLAPATPLPAIVLQDSNTIDIETSQLSHPHQYDYAPSVIYDGKIYRMWWCAGLASKGGDHIFYAESSSLDGPWHAHGSTNPNTWDDVFDATYSTADFDGQDTCDPSVVAVNGTYYMYYGGLTIASSKTVPSTTMIGVATSPDGLTWTRHSSQPIVTSAAISAGSYGAGQPSTLYKDGMFYMMYTDTTNPAGSGIYLLRSADPFFATGVQEYTASGFVPQETAKVAHHPFRTGTVDVDWTYSDALDIFVVAANGITNRTVLYIYDGNLQSVGPVQWAYGATMDGPGLVVDAQRHALRGATCNVLPMDMLREIPDGSTDKAPYNGDLAHEGVTLRATNRTCP